MDAMTKQPSLNSSLQIASNNLREISEMLFHISVLLHDHPDHCDPFSEKVEAMEQEELLGLLQDREISTRALCLLLGDQCRDMQGTVEGVAADLSEMEDDNG
jgi:hypothetical protein